MIGINRNLLSSNLLGEKVAPSGAVVSSSLRDLPKIMESSLPFSQYPPTLNTSTGNDVDFNNLSAASIEVRYHPSSSTSSGSNGASGLSSLWNWLCTTASPTTRAMDFIIPLLHHHKAFFAIKRNSEVIISRSSDGFVSSNLMEFMLLNKSKLRGEVLSVAWSNDQSPVILIGTTSGLTAVRLPYASAAETIPLDLANVELRSLTSVNFPVTSVSASPLGRLAVIASENKVYLLDVWQDQLSLIFQGNFFSSTVVERVIWSNCNDKVFVHYRNEKVIVLETFSWKSCSYVIATGDDTTVDEETTIKYCWGNSHQTLYLNNSRSIFKVNPDTENPKTKSLECIDIGSSNGLAAVGSNVIHDYELSKNGRFLVVSYRDLQTNEIGEALDVFECKDAEYILFKRISTIKRPSIGSKASPLIFQFAVHSDGSRKHGKKKIDTTEQDIYLDKSDDFSRKLLLFPPIEVRRQSQMGPVAERYFLWVVWSDHALSSYLVN